MSQDQFFVEVREFKTRQVIKRVGPMLKRKADKVQRGMDINLDHSKYYTTQVTQENAA